MDLPFKIGDDDFIVTFDYTITNPGCEAKISGPPENCYPAEGMEYEVSDISLCRDLAAPVAPDRDRIEAMWRKTFTDAEWQAGFVAPYLRRVDEYEKATAPLEIPGWLRATIETWLLESDRAREKINEDAEDWTPRPRMRSRRFG